MYIWNDFIPDASASPWIRSGKTKKMVIDRLAIESFMEQFFLFWRLGLLSNDLICLPTSSIPRTQSSVPKYLVLSEMKKYIKLLFRTRNFCLSLLKVYLYTQKQCIIPFFIITWWHYQVFFIAVRALLKIFVCPGEFDPDNWLWEYANKLLYIAKCFPFWSYK